MLQDPKVQRALEERAQRTSEKRAEVLKRYAKGEWTQLAPAVQTYQRLRRKGHEDVAQWYMRNMAEEVQTSKVDAERRSRPVFEEPAFEATVFDEPALERAAPAERREAERLILESIIGTSQIQPVRFLDSGSLLARSIGRIVTLPGRDANGTGFLVSPRLLLTNHHVLGSEDQALGNVVQFGFRQERDGTSPPPVEFRLQPDVLFLTSPVELLDFTLVAVEPSNAQGRELAQMGWSSLIGQLGKVQQGERVNIVHHPAGRPQQISVRSNLLALMLPEFLHYMTDTQGGSSGSPVYNDEWEVVALHHAGVPVTDENEKALYREVMGSSAGIGGPLIVNEGIRISRIVADLETQASGLDATGRALVADVTSGAAPGPAPAPESRAPLPSELARPAAAPPGYASWTIPLTVTVGVGGAAAFSGPGAPAIVTGAAQPPAAADGARERELELYRKAVEDQRSLLRGLAFLEEAREREYLPAPAVLQQRLADYYGDLPQRVANDALSPAQLYDELQALQQATLDIVNAFPEPLAELESLARARLESGRILESDTEYARARAHLYTWVDLRPSRMMQCVYTDTVIAPEQLMLKDALVQFDLGGGLPQNFKNNTILNAEHIVPQSWFGASGDAKSDLHHLIAARGKANLFRSNCVYRELGDAQGEEGPENRPSFVALAGRKLDDAFEPARNKRLVARATLYFLLAHKGRIEEEKYPPAALATLRTWAADPPTDYERHRNEAIFESQGNRNPLIDFPEWVDRIDFARGLG